MSSLATACQPRHGVLSYHVYLHEGKRPWYVTGTNAKHSPAHKDTEYEATPTRFYGVMRRLFPVLLRLAAGSEPVAQQLFRELVLALVHWFTRSARKCAQVY